jgi:transcriptional regulator with XRE-family HTH domain
MARRMKDDENTPRERDEFLDALGARVKAARLRKGLTQKELSTMIGASPSWIHLLEDGQQNAMIHSLRRTADALGVSVHSLLPPSSVASAGEEVAGEEEIGAAVLTELNGTINALNNAVGDLNRTVGKVHQLNSVRSRR